MRNLPTLFFVAGAMCALVGMIWGIQMSASHDHTLSPAHGHLNLIGFVAMSIFGAYYALTPQAAQSRLALVHFAMTTAAVVVLTPGIALAIRGKTETVAQVGSVIAVLSMGLYVVIILRHGLGLSSVSASPQESGQVTNPSPAANM